MMDVYTEACGHVFPSQSTADLQTWWRMTCFDHIIKTVVVFLNLFVRVKVCVRVYACGRGLPTLISVCPVVCNAPRLVIWVYLDELIGRDRAVDAWVSHRRPCRMNLSNLLWRVCLKSTHRHICWPCLGLWWCTYIQVSGHNIISLLKSFNALWVMPQVSIREHICANLYLVTEGDRTTVAHWGYFST